MKKRFKKIYLEITNACNLSCTFCIKNQRKINYLSEEEFKTILKKLEPYMGKRRCGYPDYTCPNPCGFKEGIIGLRRI